MRKEKIKNAVIIFLSFITVITTILLFVFNQYDVRFVQTGPSEAATMRDNFRTNGMQYNLSNHMIKIQYPLKEFLSITDAVKDVNKRKLVLRVYFIQLTQNSATISTNNFFQKNNGKLYVAFLYVDKNNKQVGQPFLLDDVGKNVTISDKDLSDLITAYQCNIKPQILAFSNDLKNTDYVKINVRELFEFKDKAANYTDINSSYIEFEMTESISHTGMKQAGYLTFLNNVYNSSTKKIIPELSNYNMNSLCPNQCP